jgi:hypothetical protein
MTEDEFSNMVDCRWPYGDIERSRELISTAVGISPNAAFIALHELCRLPRNADAKSAELLELVDFWLREFDHPLAFSMAMSAKSMIEDKALPAPQALTMMEAIGSYPGLYAALAIAYFSCDDSAGVASARYEAIRATWNGSNLL